MDWFLYDNGLRHERIKHFLSAKFMTSFDLQKLDQNQIDMRDLILSSIVLFDTD